MAARRRAIGTIALRSRGRDADERPCRCVGSRLKAASWLLANAVGKSMAIPITSPVDRISGPRMMSTPGNLVNGKTPPSPRHSAGPAPSMIPCSSSVLPTMTRAAACARFSPVAFDTNGTVRDARGLTSRT